MNKEINIDSLSVTTFENKLISLHPEIIKFYYEVCPLLILKTLRLQVIHRCIIMKTNGLPGYDRFGWFIDEHGYVNSILDKIEKDIYGIKDIDVELELFDKYATKEVRFYFARSRVTDILNDLIHFYIEKNTRRYERTKELLGSSKVLWITPIIPLDTYATSNLFIFAHSYNCYVDMSIGHLTFNDFFNVVMYIYTRFNCI